MKKKSLSHFIIFCFLVIIALVMLLPFAWLIFSSLRPNLELLSDPFGVPETLSLKNYTEVLARQPMLRYLFNTFAVALIAVLIDVTVSVMTGYAMMHRFRMKKQLSAMFYVGHIMD